jgi:hypothetical protein
MAILIAMEDFMAEKKKGKKLKVVLLVLGVIVVICIIANVTGGSDGSETAKSAEPAAPSSETSPVKNTSAKSYKAGMYKVGSELPAGEYIFEGTSTAAYYAVSSDSSGELESIIVNDTLNKGNFSYIIVKDGDYLKTERGRLVPAADLNIQPKSLDNIPPSTYKVGKDIPAGEYKLTANNDSAYWERSSNPRDSIDGIIANDIISDTAYVTVKAGEYFKILGATGQKAN